MKKIIGYMLMSLCFVSLGSYANTAVTTSIVNTVAASSVLNEPEVEEVAEPVVTSVKIDAKEKTYNVEPAGSYMMTICSSEQVQTAFAWQTLCSADRHRSFSSDMCPVLSFFRYCQPATAHEVKGLKPVKANYKNVFLSN